MVAGRVPLDGCGCLLLTPLYCTAHFTACYVVLTTLYLPLTTYYVLLTVLRICSFLLTRIPRFFLFSFRRAGSTPSWARSGVSPHCASWIYPATLSATTTTTIWTSRPSSASWYPCVSCSGFLVPCDVFLVTRPSSASWYS